MWGRYDGRALRECYERWSGDGTDLSEGGWRCAGLMCADVLCAMSVCVCVRACAVRSDDCLRDREALASSCES